MDSGIILSICIPTFNRAPILSEVLKRYADNPEFDDSVEIVICDNASTDDTYGICQHFISLNRNIRYFRNSRNLKDENFPIVLSHGTGEYLKLSNDSYYIDELSLHYLKEKISKHLKDRKQIFFTNGFLFTKNIKEEMNCADIDEYIQRVSTFVTCNNLFGVWREDWMWIQDKRRYSELQLQQEDWTYRLVSYKNGCVLYNKEVMKEIEFKTIYRTPYNWFKVHLDNYYTIMLPYVKNGQVSKHTFRKDKRYLLKHFMNFLYEMYIFPRKIWWQTEGTFSLLWKYYKLEPYFYFFMAVLPVRYRKQAITRICNGRS